MSTPNKPTTIKIDPMCEAMAKADGRFDIGRCLVEGLDVYLNGFKCRVDSVDLDGVGEWHHSATAAPMYEPPGIIVKMRIVEGIDLPPTIQIDEASQTIIAQVDLPNPQSHPYKTCKITGKYVLWTEERQAYFKPWEDLGILDSVPLHPGEGWEFLLHGAVPQEGDEFWDLKTDEWVASLQHRHRKSCPCHSAPSMQIGPYRRRIKSTNPDKSVHPMCEAMSRTQLRYVSLTHDGSNAVLSTTQMPQPTPRPFSAETGVLHYHEATCSCKRTLPRGSQGCSCNPFKLAPTQDPPTISLGTDYPKYDLGNTMLSISKPAENITQLPNCRKCGGEPMLRTHDNRFIRWSWVECTGCPCRTNVAGSDFQAIQEWKRGDVICDKSVAGESPGISPEPEQAESAITALHVGKEYSINGVPCYLHSMTPDGTPKTENAYTTMPDFICLFVPCGAPTTPSAAVGASEPGAGDKLVDGDTFPRSVIDGLELQIRVLQCKVEGKDRVLTEQRDEIRRLTKLNHHLREVAVMAIVERVPSDSKPTNACNPESEDTPPHKLVMGPVVGTATVTLRDWCQKSSGTRFPSLDKPFQLEVGKRYVCGNGEVTDAMTLDGGPAYPFMARTDHVLRSWRGDGRHDESKISEYDLIDEYHEPEPSPPAESEVDRLQRELDAAVEYHANYTSKIDKALGQPRHGGDLLTEHLREIERLTYLPPAASQPAESPDDWVTQDRVPLRKIDEFRYLWAAGNVSPWCTGSEDSRLMHNSKDGDDVIEIRCRRKDLPVVPAESPASQPSCSPVCALCGNVATCFGQYADHDKGFACDSCCGHGNEDGWCMPVVPAEKPALPSPWRPMTEVPTCDWFWLAWDDGKVILSRDRVHWPCPYAIAWIQVEKPQPPNAATADKPRMRQVTLREYRFGHNGNERAWTTAESENLFYIEGRTAVVEVPE